MAKQKGTGRENPKEFLLWPPYSKSFKIQCRDYMMDTNSVSKITNRCTLYQIAIYFGNGVLKTINKSSKNKK